MPHEITPRQEFQRTDGFALYTDVNDHLMDELGNRYIPKISTHPSAKLLITGDIYDSVIDGNPAGASLHLAMKNILNSTVPKGDELLNQSEYGITLDDKDRADTYAFFGGFNDMDFAWHFSAGVANAVADRFITEGVITQEQKDNFTLHDWADIIGSGWFSRMAHELALSGNGTYGRFGLNLTDYSEDGFAKSLVQHKILETPTEPALTYKEQEDEVDGLTYATAEPSKEVVQRLRQRMHAYDGGSFGCPAARYSVQLPADMVETNPHVQNLLERGTLEIVPERSTGEKIRLTQEWSAIDKTLSLFGAQLDTYEATYGTPHIVPGREEDEKIVKHNFSQPVDALRWPTPSEE
jgi:hypothetical protein